MICPNCHAPKLRRSHSRNAKEHFLKLFGRMAFRCEACQWRGILKVPGRTVMNAREWMKWILIYAIMILMIYLLALSYAEWSAYLSRRPFGVRIGFFAAAVFLAGVVIFKAPVQGMMRIIVVTLAVLAVLMTLPAVFF